MLADECWAKHCALCMHDYDVRPERASNNDGVHVACMHANTLDDEQTNAEACSRLVNGASATPVVDRLDNCYMFCIL